MSLLKIASAVAACSVATLWISHSALASPIETQSGYVVRWARSLDNPILNYWVDPALGSNFGTWARAAFALWENVPEAYIRFTEVASESSADIKVKGYTALSNSLVPQQASRAHASDGTISSCEAQVVIGADTTGSPAAEYLVYLQSGVIHEVGHCLGLQHSLTTDAIMSYRSGSPLTLADDDRFALALLYPQDGETKYPLGCASLQTPGDRGSGPGRGAEMALWAAVLALAWRVSRRSLVPFRQPALPAV